MINRYEVTQTIIDALTADRDIARMVARHRRVHDCPYCDCSTLDTMHELHPTIWGQS
jgi:hypothetical protein